MNSAKDPINFNEIPVLLIKKKILILKIFFLFGKFLLMFWELRWDYVLDVLV